MLPEYPPEWDEQEPVYIKEYMFSHWDLFECECEGSMVDDFVANWKSRLDKNQFVCDKCGHVALFVELEKRAKQVYGEDWERMCSIAREQVDESWDY